ncbi:reverse transcriptase domain-containing protein [Tanacetum coccineum]
MFGSRRSRELSKYCHFYEDHRHDTNDCRQLRSQIEEAVKLGQLSHLVKGIKKERAKASKNQRFEGKEDKGTTPTEAPILLIRQKESYTRDNTSEDFITEGREIMFPLVTRGSNSSAPVIIKVKIFEREVGRVHMDSGSSCEGSDKNVSWTPTRVIIRFKWQKKTKIRQFLRRRKGFRLPKDALWFKECWSDIPKVSRQGSRSGTLRNEEICGGLTNAHSTDTRKGSDNIPLNFDREHKRSFIRKKGRRSGSHLFRKQSPHTSALTKLKKSRQVAKWEIELGEHDIVFQKRCNDKKEMPKDFFIEVPLEDNRKEAEGRTNMKSEKTKLSFEWTLYTDRAASSDSSGARLMLIDPEGKEYTYTLHFGFETTTNEAEYKALLSGLRIAQDMEIISLTIFIDSQLLGFDSYTIEHIRRNQNKKADALSKMASMTFEHLTKEVLVEVISKRSIEGKEILQVETKEEESWMTPIHEYLVSDVLPEDPKESRKIRVKAPQYKQIRGSLYRRATLKGGQNYKARILLALDAQGRRKGNSRLREMQGAICNKEGGGKWRNNSWKWMVVQSLGS